MITFTSGDLLQAEASYIAQGVAIGSQEGLGTGLALKISTRWPDAQQQFKRHTRSASFGGGGLCVIPPTAHRPGIIYIATQPDMYHATHSYLNRGLRNLARHCAKRGIPSVALPKIGAGLGKLDWQTEVRPLMQQHLASGATQFIIYEDFRLEHERGE